MKKLTSDFTSLFFCDLALRLTFERDDYTGRQTPPVSSVSGPGHTTHAGSGTDSLGPRPQPRRAWAGEKVKTLLLTVLGDFVGRVEACVSAGGRAHVQVEQGVVPQPVAAVLQPHEYGALPVLSPLAAGRKRLSHDCGPDGHVLTGVLLSHFVVIPPFLPLHPCMGTSRVGETM